ncbi:TPA: hypothetical protein DDZ01_03415 [Candidatus Uhrbacteria bacterium]|nr:MAG: hypothetical protein UT94_C0002G0021 [Candidatus Uhrbacteria bacterium GW2011_GWF2_40_263]OGL97394.1 MAG: hypothetical protein A2332_04720 [Candidatus Uhrbacteria bacterium RIFOXYB2_FULL_41_18]HBK35016.1 hypothetical protein [Candidatus Uhrbacteria bacterium]HCB56169.1 hypothetical protein [Candidatus Uhrbacteria bacterium]
MSRFLTLFFFLPLLLTGCPDEEQPKNILGKTLVQGPELIQISENGRMEGIDRLVYFVREQRTGVCLILIDYDRGVGMTQIPCETIPGYNP